MVLDDSFSGGGQGGALSSSRQEGSGFGRRTRFGCEAPAGGGDPCKGFAPFSVVLVWGKQGCSPGKQQKSTETAALAGPGPLLGRVCMRVYVYMCVSMLGSSNWQKGGKEVGVLAGRMVYACGEGCVCCVCAQRAVCRGGPCCLYTHTQNLWSNTVSLNCLRGESWCVCVCVCACTWGACVQDRGSQAEVCKACPRRVTRRG